MGLWRSGSAYALHRVCHDLDTFLVFKMAFRLTCCMGSSVRTRPTPNRRLVWGDVITMLAVAHKFYLFYFIFVAVAGAGGSYNLPTILTMEWLVLASRCQVFTSSYSREELSLHQVSEGGYTPQQAEVGSKLRAKQRQQALIRKVNNESIVKISTLVAFKEYFTLLKLTWGILFLKLHGLKNGFEMVGFIQVPLSMQSMDLVLFKLLGKQTWTSSIRHIHVHGCYRFGYH